MKSRMLSAFTALTMLGVGSLSILSLFGVRLQF